MPRHRWQKILVGIGVGCAIFLTLCLALLHFYPAFAANTADSVLRPVIGDQQTVAIESFFFSINDFFKQASYQFGAKPSGDVFTNTPSITLPVPKNDQPTLYTLSLKQINFHPGKYPALPHEGEWSPITMGQFNGRIDMAKAFVEPDPNRAYAITSLVKINMHYIYLHAVAGTKQPGGPIGQAGPGVIASADQTSNLVAAFNGGFQYKDGKYGMVVGAKTYVPLQDGLGTLIIHKDNKVSIEPYTSGQSNISQARAVRQNGPMIVENGIVTPATTTGGMARWGLTVTNSMYTWRSGVGVTKNGNLIYAVGPSLTTHTLAEALKAGGATNAIQLDINPYWVRFVMFHPSGTGSYSYTTLLKDMQNGGPEYLRGYGKDFFYLTMAP